MQSWEAAIYTLSVSVTPNPNLQKERRERENNRRQTGCEQLRQINNYWLCSKKTLVLHRRIQGQQDRSTEITEYGIKVLLYLSGSAARRSIIICQYVTCNPHWHLLHKQSTIKRVQLGTPDHIYIYSIHNTATYRRCSMLQSNTTPVKKTDTCNYSVQQF